jgi:hypothetical protein
MVGAIVSTRAIVWLHTLVLPHGAVATHVRVATNVLPQPKLVTVPSTVIIAVPQLLVAVGTSKLKSPPPHSLVLLPAQVITGPSVATLAIV